MVRISLVIEMPMAVEFFKSHYQWYRSYLITRLW